jgi:subtilase family serine protease
VQIGASDLIETAVSNPPAAASVGGSFAVTDTVLNQGTGPSKSSTTRYYLSSDGVALTKLLTGTRAVPVLAVNATSSGTVTVTIPTNTVLGPYALLVCADDTHVVTESNETNNCRAAATTVQVGISDLVESAVSNPPATALVGSSFSVTDTVQNQGTGPSKSSTTRYYLSSDGVQKTRLLTGSRVVPVLAVNASSTGTATVTVSAGTTAGTYFLLACADDKSVVTEGSETNNCLASASQVVVGP